VELLRKTWDGQPALRMRADSLGADEWGEWLLLPVGRVRFRPTDTGWEPFFAMTAPTIAVVGSGNRWVAALSPAWWKVDLTSPVHLRSDGADWCDLFLALRSFPWADVDRLNVQHAVSV